MQMKQILKTILNKKIIRLLFKIITVLVIYFSVLLSVLIILLILLIPPHFCKIVEKIENNNKEYYLMKCNFRCNKLGKYYIVIRDVRYKIQDFEFDPLDDRQQFAFFKKINDIYIKNDKLFVVVPYNIKYTISEEYQSKDNISKIDDNIYKFKKDWFGVDYMIIKYDNK